MNYSAFVWKMPLAIVVIVAIWIAVYSWYLAMVKKAYNKRYIKLDDITPKSPDKDRMLLIYFVRYQSYEISAYLLLGLTVLILSICVFIFLFANELIPVSRGIISEQYIFLSGLSIRVGISLIVFFITRVLIRLYRYCLRLSIFYMSRFDTLFMYKFLDLDLKKTADLLTPQEDVGKEPPEVIPEKLLDFLKQLKEFQGK